MKHRPAAAFRHDLPAESAAQMAYRDHMDSARLAAKYGDNEGLDYWLKKAATVKEGLSAHFLASCSWGFEVQA